MKKFLLTLSLLCAGTACAITAASCGNSKYSYSFNTNGGSSVETIEANEGDTVTLPTTQKDGYAFEGWYLTEDFSGDPVSSVVANGNATYYAKWAKTYTVNLNLDGGSLSTTTISLKAGENIYDSLQNYVPTKSGLVFGAWYDGDSELGKNTRMPENSVTLTAKYKVEYTIELWLQNTTLDDYEKSDNVTGYEYVGATYTADKSVAGFTVVDNASTVSTKTLTANKSENLFKLYYDREEYSVSFMSNYPDGTSGDNRTVTARYGVEVALPTDYTVDGYLLVGWSKSANGSVDYNVNYIDSLLYNGDNTATVTADKFTTERNTALYAVWSKGYVDMFGGNDYIYLFDETSKVIYLNRGGVYFKGEYSDKTKEFTFSNSKDATILEGRLNSDGTYVYYNESRDGYSSTHFVVGQGLDESVVIYFDAYNGLTYSEKGIDGKASNSKGTYVLDSDGYYHISFTEGTKAGEEMVIQLGTTSASGSSQAAFVIRNEEEYALGQLYRGVVYNGSLTYFTSVYSLTLNGFGNATYAGTSSSATYYYTVDKNDNGTEITLLSSYGTTVGVARLVTISNTQCYFFYNSDLDATFTAEDGSTLTLDGMYNATYKNGSTTLTGYYSADSSSLVTGGTVLSFYTGNETYKFVTSTTTEQEVGSEQTITINTFEKKGANYDEYYYKDASGLSRAPLIVLNDEEDGKASIYDYNSTTATYEKVSSGTVIYDEEKGLYYYTADKYFENNGDTSSIDLSKLKSIVFNVTTYTSSSSYYDVNYWYSSTIEGGETENKYYIEYKSDKNGTLTLVAGYAVFEEDGRKLTGTYLTNTAGNLLQITVTSGTTTSYIYIELDTENNKFITLTTPPYNASAYNMDGSTNSAEYLSFDGKGGVTYTKDEVLYTGTLTNTGRTSAGGYTIYNFTSTDGTINFEFIEPATSSAVYFAKYNSAYDRTYRSAKYGMLTLDGFGFSGTYTNTNGVKSTGMFFVQNEKLIIMYINETYTFFDFDADGGFTVKGTEYGDYVLVKNQAPTGVFIELDGYGKALVFTAETVDGETIRNYIDENGTYTVNGELFTVTYTQTAENGSSNAVTLVGKLSTYTISSSSTSLDTFVIFKEEVVRTYVNDSDWSVLTLDGYGNVVRYTTDGEKENGSYTLITDELLYYVNEAGTDASIFKYNNTTGTITPVSMTARGYYTEDLESLLFSKYGFAIFNGTTRYYYSENKTTGQVTIYRQDASNKDANEYGFIEDNFGSFDNVKIYGGKTYYANDGFALDFKRNEATQNNYPVLISSENNQYAPLEELIFTPDSSSEFTVSGTVIVAKQSYSCYVTRKVGDDGKVEIYITVGTYQFDIKLSYGGRSETSSSGNNTYEVIGMKRIVEAPAYSYIYYYYMVYMFYGATYANMISNTVGTVDIVWEFDEEGKMGDPYLNGNFGENSGMYDANGNLIKIEKASFVEENNIFYIEFKGDDGYDYIYHMQLSSISFMSSYAYSGILLRVQTLTDSASGLTVKASKIIASDSAYYTAGSLFSVELYNGENAISADTIRYIGDDLYYVSRTKDETSGKITGTTYYKIVLKDKVSSLEEENENIIPVFDSEVTVTVETADTYYTEDETTYVDVVGGTVKLINVNGTNYSANECVFDQASGTYTITSLSGKQFKVKIDGTKATVEEVAEDA